MSQFLLAQDLRHLPPWLIFDVRQKEIMQIRSFSFLFFALFAGALVGCSDRKTTVTDVVRVSAFREDYVMLYFTRSAPQHGVAIPKADFDDDLVMAAVNGQPAIVGHFIAPGHFYHEKKIKARGKMTTQADGARILFVASRDDVDILN